MKTLDQYLALAEVAHGHLCAGQVLGVRMAMHGLALLGIEDPQGADRKRLVTFVEIDRCLTDAIAVVTGCRIGKRALKFRDFGKAAATFCDLANDRAVRLAAKESARSIARTLHPEIEGKAAQQLAAYRVMDDADLFDVAWVRVRLTPEQMPGFKSAAACCAGCGEAVKFGRQVEREGRVLCRACAGESYYEPL